MMGVFVGICLVCGRKFLPTDADYTIWMEKPSGCRPSKSGVEVQVSFEENQKHFAEDRANRILAQVKPVYDDTSFDCNRWSNARFAEAFAHLREINAAKNKIAESK